MISVTAAGKPVDWPKISRKDDYYINEEGMYIGFFCVSGDRIEKFFLKGFFLSIKI